MKRGIGIACFLGAIVVVAGTWSCGEGESEDERPTLVKHRFESEMRAILRDVKMAEEQAAVLEDRYVDLDVLRARYLNRTVPESYRLAITEVSSRGFRAEIEHEATGLRCRLVVGSGPSGSEPSSRAESGVPDCR